MSFVGATPQAGSAMPPPTGAVYGFGGRASGGAPASTTPVNTFAANTSSGANPETIAHASLSKLTTGEAAASDTQFNVPMAQKTVLGG